MYVLTVLVHNWERENMDTWKYTKKPYDEGRKKGVVDEVMEIFKQRNQKIAEIDTARHLPKVDEVLWASLRQQVQFINVSLASSRSSAE